MSTKVLKINKWWGSHFGPMLAFIYLATAFSSHPPSLFAFASTLALFTIASIGIASFGQLTNDLMDIQQDLRSGAYNTVAKLRFGQRWLLFGFIIILGLLPWQWLPMNGIIASLLILEYLLFILYSMPPARLKGRGILGVLTDSLYGYVVTNAVAIFVFMELSNLDMPWFALTAAVWMFFFGLSQIIQHQLVDASRDEIDGIKTFVIANGWSASLRFAKNIIAPLDCITFLIFLVVIGFKAPLVPIAFVIHMLFLVQWWNRQTCWGLKGLNSLSACDQLSLCSYHGIARFTWHWLPSLSLLTLVISDLNYLPLVPVHLILFPAPVRLLIQYVISTLCRPLERI